MKIKIIQVVIRLCSSILAAIVIIAATGPSVQALDAGELLSYFIDQLTPYGRWHEVSPYGRVWEPNDQNQRDWRPYSRGYWVYSEEYGWVWEAEEQWGEIPYHYGRWTQSSNRWFWVPDRTWGPAWVDWRQNDDYIGWAPLPPEADWRGEGEWQPRISYFSSAPTTYVTIPQRYFGDSNIYNYIVSPDRNVIVLDRGENITSYRTVDRRVRNEGPRREVVERVIGRRIQPVRYVPRSIQAKQQRTVKHEKVKHQDEARNEHPRKEANQREVQARHDKKVEKAPNAEKDGGHGRLQDPTDTRVAPDKAGKKAKHSSQSHKKQVPVQKGARDAGKSDDQAKGHAAEDKDAGSKAAKDKDHKNDKDANNEKDGKDDNKSSKSVKKP